MKLVGVERFELPTPWSQTRCATRLRYTPTSNLLAELFSASAAHSIQTSDPRQLLFSNILNITAFRLNINQISRLNRKIVLCIDNSLRYHQYLTYRYINQPPCFGFN